MPSEQFRRASRNAPCKGGNGHGFHCLGRPGIVVTVSICHIALPAGSRLQCYQVVDMGKTNMDVPQSFSTCRAQANSKATFGCTKISTVGALNSCERKANASIFFSLIHRCRVAGSAKSFIDTGSTGVIPRLSAARRNASRLSALQQRSGGKDVGWRRLLGIDYGYWYTGVSITLLGFLLLLMSA